MLLDPAKDIKIGTSGYSYAGRPPKGWYGAFYPEKKTKGFDELEYYSQIFNTCEINNTFYRAPSATVTKAWATNSNDTSAVWAMAIASSGDPSFVAPGAIPWLLLEVVGDQKGSTDGARLKRTAFIQRLNTSGGLAPMTGCSGSTDIGMRALVPYTADYFFYKGTRREDSESE
jgi:hypothetical protein